MEEKILEYRQKEVQLVEMLHRNEATISRMEEIVKQAAQSTSAGLRVDACTSSSEDFREHWSQGVASIAAQPALALAALERERASEEQQFLDEQAAFMAEFTELQGQCVVLRGIVHSRLRQ